MAAKATVVYKIAERSVPATRRTLRTSDLRVSISQGQPILHWCNIATGLWEDIAFIKDESILCEWYVVSLETLNGFEFVIQVTLSESESFWINRDNEAFKNFIFPPNGGVFQLKKGAFNISNDEVGPSVLGVHARMALSLCYTAECIDRFDSLISAYAEVRGLRQCADDRACKAIIRCVHSNYLITVLPGGTLLSSPSFATDFFDEVENELFVWGWDVTPHTIPVCEETDEETVAEPEPVSMRSIQSFGIVTTTNIVTPTIVSKGKKEAQGASILGTPPSLLPPRSTTRVTTVTTLYD